MKKRICTFILVVLMIFQFTACRQDQRPTETQTDMTTIATQPHSTQPTEHTEKEEPAPLVSIVQLDAIETPFHNAKPTEDWKFLQYDAVNLNHSVYASYFSCPEIIAVQDGGLLTSFYNPEGLPGCDSMFWAFDEEVIQNIVPVRVDFTLSYQGQQFPLVFEYCVHNGQLWANAWQAETEGNSFHTMVLPIADRTDAVLLLLPANTADGDSFHVLELNLSTLEAADILEGFHRDQDIIMLKASEDFNYLITKERNPETKEEQLMLYNLAEKSAAAWNDIASGTVINPYFMDKDVIFWKVVGQNEYEIWKYNLKNQTQERMLDHVKYMENGVGYCGIQQNGGNGAHCLLYREDGTIDLFDFRTGTSMKIQGLNKDGLVTSESPDGRRIMFAHRFKSESSSEPLYDEIGVLDTDTGVLTVFSRETENISEHFFGWISPACVIFTAKDQEKMPYLYVYDFSGEGAARKIVYQEAEAETSAESEASEVQQPEVTASSEPDDADFVNVQDYIPDILVDLRYATADNFTGQPIYDFSTAWLRYGTVKKLVSVQESLKENGMGLKIWDAFRPTSAQFRLWEICPDPVYVADPNNGFSSHSRGNTLDITLVYSDGSEVKMPTGFDDFTNLADRDYQDCDEVSADNAQYLEQIMQEHGFEGYFGEWWHYSDATSYEVEDEFIPAE